MDNQVFNINGRTLEQLKTVLKLALSQGTMPYKCTGWSFIKEKGLVLFWSKPYDKTIEYNRFIFSNPDSIAEMAFEWIKSEDALSMKFEGWDGKLNHDGETKLGWRVYKEDWGKIGDEVYSVCAIRPAFIWYGK